MARRVGIVAAAAVLALAGCGQDGSPAPNSAGAPATTSSAYKLGENIAFKRASNGQPIGVIRIMEVVAVPEECLSRYTKGPVIAVRSEIDNPGEVFLPEPDLFSVKAIDRRGFTQDVDVVNIEPTCGFPRIASSQSHGKTTGWSALSVQEADPTGLVYAPLVGEPDSSLENLKFVTVSPSTATIALPSPLPRRGETPAPETKTEPTKQPPTSAPRPAAPAAGKACDIDSDTWAKDSSGQQLRCAYAGGPTPKWVESLPFVGRREPGTRCMLGVGVAETTDGQTMVCVGDQDSGTWQPGP